MTQRAVGDAKYINGPTPRESVLSFSYALFEKDKPGKIWEGHYRVWCPFLPATNIPLPPHIRVRSTYYRHRQKDIDDGAAACKRGMAGRSPVEVSKSRRVTPL